jgi:hypothetical protein
MFLKQDDLIRVQRNPNTSSTLSCRSSTGASSAPSPPHHEQLIETAPGVTRIPDVEIENGITCPAA